MQRFIDAITKPFRRRKRRRTVPATPPSAFWRSPESVPIKKDLMERAWGKGTVPSVLTYDMTPLRSLGFEEMAALATLFYGKAQYASGNITWRDSQSVDAPMVYLTIKHARTFQGEIEIRGYRLPLYRASHRLPGRSSGSPLNFAELLKDEPDLPRKTG